MSLCLQICICSRACLLRLYVYMYINILQFYGVAGKEDEKYNQTAMN